MYNNKNGNIRFLWKGIIQSSVRLTLIPTCLNDMIQEVCNGISMFYTIAVDSCTRYKLAVAFL